MSRFEVVEPGPLLFLEEAVAPLVCGITRLAHACSALIVLAASSAGAPPNASVLFFAIALVSRAVYMARVRFTKHALLQAHKKAL